MTPKDLMFAVFLALSTVLSGCSGQDSEETTFGTEDGTETATQYRIAGTVALGRPGQWAEVCLDTDCTRANGEGDYRLTGEFEQTALLTASVPNPNGSETELTSLYRFQEGQTASLVNLNPLTNAILDAWSRYDRSQPLADCMTTPSCETALTAGFTPTIQARVLERLQQWVGDEWHTERQPFTDPYLADPELDWLDNLFDHLHLDVDDTSIGLTDNDGFELGRLSHASLFEPNITVLPLDAGQLEAALMLEPATLDTANPVEISYRLSPGSEVVVPEDIQVDASASYSLVPGALTYLHELTDPNGTVQTVTSAVGNATLTLAGPHHWVITVTDADGNQATTGLVVEAQANNVIADPTFGADGSCQTTQMTANSQNICEETLDGGALGQCEATVSGSTQTIRSPAPCSPIQQHGGRFLGVCTVVLNEIRVFHYENPLRNTGQTLDEQRALKAGHCEDVFGGTWSIEP